MFEIITSLQNPAIKNIIKLQKSKDRKEQNLFVIEGVREINLAISQNYEIKQLYFCPELIQQQVEELISSKQIKRKTEISHSVFEKIAYREGSDGLIALAEPKHLKLEEIILPPNPLIIVLESIEKPGNLGAILRTADAANVDAVIICDPLCDIYNPNTIRSSIGCIFTNQIVVCSSEETIKWLKNSNIKSYAAALTANKYYHETNLSGAVALVMGTEAFGLSEKWLSQSDYQIKIPMLGKIDSLNVSTSTAILVFEAMRQRNFNA